MLKGKSRDRMNQVNIRTHKNVRTVNSEWESSANIEYVFVADGTNDSSSKMI